MANTFSFKNCVLAPYEVNFFNGTIRRYVNEGSLNRSEPYLKKQVSEVRKM